MSIEVLESIRSINSNLNNNTIVKIITNKRSINVKLPITKEFSKKSGVIYNYSKGIKQICKELNIDTVEYFEVDKIDELGILPFDYSQKIMHLNIYNID